MWLNCSSLVLQGALLTRRFFPRISKKKKHVQRSRLTKSMRDRGDIPYAQTVLASGWRRKHKTLPKGLQLSLSSSQEHVKGHRRLCRIDGSTNFEDLVQAVHPDLLKANHNTFDGRGILAPTDASIPNQRIRSSHAAWRSTAREKFRLDRRP